MQPRLLKHPARLAGASLLKLQDDARLVALAREGHDPAFAAIVDRYGSQLERYCARLLGPARAEDAVQQAFVNAHAAMRASEAELALKPWLYRIAHNAALNILRASRDESEALDESRAGATQTADVVELRERLRETLASIQALPAAQRDAILLREVEGRSHEEIAVALGVTAGGARQHLHRARMSLRAAASAITPYPLLARVLSAAAAEGGRGADLVSGAGMGVGAGAMKAAAGVLAAGAIAGGAVTVQHHDRAGSKSDRASIGRSSAAPRAANGLPAAHDVADDNPAGARPRRGHGHGRHGAPGRGGDDHGRRHGAEVHRRGGGGDDGLSHEIEHHSAGGSSGGSGTSGKTEESHSGSGSSGSGSGSSGSDDITTTATTTTDGSGAGSPGSDDGISSSGSGSGETTTTTTPTTTTDNSGPGGGGSDDATRTTDG